MIHISEVQVVPMKPTDGLLGFASIIIDGSFYLGNIGIHNCPTKPSGYRITYPTKKIFIHKDATKNLPIFNPIRKDVADAIEKSVVDRYKAVMGVA